jgi:hypothetical protein
MRISAFAAITLTLALAGCGQPAPQQADGCARSATHDVVWSQAETPDVITTSAHGPTCSQAVVTFVARKANGDPLWAFAALYYDLTLGGAPPDDAPALTEAQMDTFLASWADVTRTTTNTLPEWRVGAATLSESAQTFSYDTPFDRETYEMLRTQNLPMICYQAAVEGTQCLIVDPPTGAAIMFVAYGP